MFNIQCQLTFAALCKNLSLRTQTVLTVAMSAVTYKLSGFGGLDVAYWPLVPKFAGSNPAEAVEFFREKKSSARLPSEGR